MVFPLRLMAALMGAATVSVLATAKEYRVTLPAAAVDRAAQVVNITLPPEAPSAAVLVGRNGAVLDLQRGQGGAACFVVPEQKAGESLRFTLRASERAAAGDGVTAVKEEGRLRLAIGPHPVLDFQMDRDALPRGDIKPEYRRAGYIHPVFTPAGRVVTDDYPSNHVHHHGIWTPWTKTSFQGRHPDFWNMGTKTGAEDVVALDRTWQGPVQGGFEARLRMVDLSAASPVVALNETWRVTAYRVPAVSGGAVHVFDLEVTQACATRDPVVLPEYHYGGFGLRGAGEWNGPRDAAMFLTSEGVTDRIAGNNTRARWCYLGGRLAGGVAGTTVFGHPGNFRAPQPLRLHPNMPYLSFVPQQLGEFAITPGQPYLARFRFVAADGPPDRARLEAFWNGFASPATAQIDAVP